MTADEALASVDADRLPPQARQLVRIIGLPGTVRLLRAYGGGRINVPCSAQGAVALRAVLTDSELAALAGSHWAGQRLELPTLDKIARQVRDAQIRDDLTHMPLDAVARAWGMSRKQVKNIRKAGPPEACITAPTVSATGDLFP